MMSLLMVGGLRDAGPQAHPHPCAEGPLDVPVGAQGSERCREGCVMEGRRPTVLDLLAVFALQAIGSVALARLFAKVRAPKGMN